jgi:putative transposase
LVIGIVSDMEKPFAESQAAYAPLREELALDFGLSTMFFSPDGDLLGRAWFDQIRRHDRRIAGLARRLQKQGAGRTGWRQRGGPRTSSSRSSTSKRRGSRAG